MRYTLHWRTDSDAFRVYDVAVLAHLESRYPSEVNLKRGSAAEPRGSQWSRFANSFIYHAASEAVEKWARSRVCFFRSSAIWNTVDWSDENIRDERRDTWGK